jgi:hypothetical protein
MRFWGFVALASLFALIATTVWSQGAVARRDPPVSPNQTIALDALVGFTALGDEGLAQQFLNRVRQRLRLAAAADPDAPRTGKVLLRRGLGPAEVDALLSRHGLGFAGAEAKTPVSDGTVMTMWATQFGPFPAPPGTIAEQVERNLGGQRMLFLRRAQAAGNTQEGRLAREIATSHELGVYRLDVWGKQGSLAALLDEADVRGVMADDNDRLAVFYEARRREMDATPIIRGPTTQLIIPDAPDVAFATGSDPPATK